MPLFEYICKECDRHFEALVRGEESPACPECSSMSLERQFSRFSAGSSSSADFGCEPGPCGSCGDPRGPGACSMN